MLLWCAELKALSNKTSEQTCIRGVSSSSASIDSRNGRAAHEKPCSPGPIAQWDGRRAQGRCSLMLYIQCVISVFATPNMPGAPMRELPSPPYFVRPEHHPVRPRKKSTETKESQHGSRRKKLMVKRIEKCRVSGSTNLISVLSLGDQALTGIFPKSREQAVTVGPLEIVS